MFEIVEANKEMLNNLKTCQIRLSLDLPLKLKAANEVSDTEDNAEMCSGEPPASSTSKDPSTEINTTTCPFRSNLTPEEWEDYVVYIKKTYKWSNTWTNQKLEVHLRKDNWRDNIEVIEPE